jgi:AcrR family transcriptional regulator
MKGRALSGTSGVSHPVARASVAPPPLASTPALGRQRPVTRPTDGRVVRRLVNRTAVVDTLIGLFNEGVVDPSLEEIAQRAGVSARSVFRYFDSLDELRSAVVRRSFERVGLLVLTPEMRHGSLNERMVAVADGRAALYEVVAGVARVARGHELEVAAVGAQVAAFRRQLLQQLREAFSPELSRLRKVDAEERLVSLAVLLSFESWDLQTRCFQRSRAQVRSGWLSAMSALFRSR